MTNNQGDFMVGYPVTYGDSLEESKGFISETLFNGISEYCSDEKTQENFSKGYKFGLVVFGIGSLLVSSISAFAEGEGSLSTNSGAGSCPGTGSGSSGPPPSPSTSGSLANVPTADWGTYAASTLGICAIAMKSGAFYIGFVYAAAIIIGVRMASVPANFN